MKAKRKHSGSDFKDVLRKIRSHSKDAPSLKEITQIVEQVRTERYEMNQDKFSDEEQKKALLAKLKEGEESGLVENFDPEEFLRALHRKYLPPNTETEPGTENAER